MLTTVDILGAEYTVVVRKYDEDKNFARNHCCGYCYSHSHQIVVCDMSTYKGWEHEPQQIVEMQQKETLRHEIVHVFFHESGLKCNSNTIDDAWARNEEMVDWIAIQGPKIWRAWQEAGAV